MASSFSAHRHDEGKQICDEEEEEEDECDDGSNEEISPADELPKGPIKLRIDMSSIPCINSDEQLSELQELGVVAYEQQCYEKGVLKQVDDAINNPKVHDDCNDTDEDDCDDDCGDGFNNVERQDDADEYIPTGEELPTDDSDQEVFNETFEDSTKKRKSVKKIPTEKKLKLDNGPMKVTKKKVIDDGDEAAYQKRMRAVNLDMQQSSSGGISKDGDLHSVDGDFKVPSNLWSRLYNYQQRGVQWLWELHQLGCGGILGDEMGLGKTIQIIAFLAGLSVSEVSNFRDERRTLGPVILVTPATVMHQWVAEFHSWWPFFRVAILHHTGSYSGKKKNLVRAINRSNGILITSYCSIVTYQEILYDYDWHYVILDEGHKIRNPDALTTLACKRFRSPHRIILSGSPIQNNLKELWSLFDFIYPGKLGTLPVFMEKFAVPITQGGYANASEIQVSIAYRCATVLRDAIKPYLLRRVKDEVQTTLELPQKNEQVLFCRLTDEQRDVYKNYLESNMIRDICKGKTQLFVGLINLRKICNHPDLFTDGPKTETDHVKDTYGYYKRSGKMKVVNVLLSLWQKQGHKVLLFCQGKQMLSILERFLRYRSYTYLTMDGGTPIGSRQQIVKEFNSNPNIFVFLLTTKVGGVGLNLIGANRVLIYDPDWNPTTDMQARERAWRIGQEKQVTIYRLLTAGTVEEKIYHRQVFKQYLTNRVLKNPKQQRFFKTNDLHELFTLGNDSSKTESSALFAGTGSKVKVNKSAKNVTKKDKHIANDHSLLPDKITLPPEKIKELQDRAKKLSQIISEKFKNKTLPNLPENQATKSNCDATNHLQSMKPSSSSSSSSINLKNTYAASGSTKNSLKSKKQKGSLFEGKRIKYLVKTDFGNSFKQGNSTDENDLSKQQDDYVLKKLFKKSSMHSALRHDVIEGQANTDFVLIESEADKVANEAISALRRSRQECHAPSSGIPTWTGSAKSFPTANRFGKGRRDRLPGSASGSGNSVPSSASLVQAIKERNKFQKPENEDQNDASSTTQKSTISQEHEELLNDIRNYIAFQASTDGEATTQEILERFSDRISPQLTPIFKSLLWKISDFHRRTDGAGVWRIKGEFR